MPGLDECSCTCLVSSIQNNGDPCLSALLSVQRRRELACESQLQREASVRSAWEDRSSREAARAAAEARAHEAALGQARQARMEAEVARQREQLERLYAAPLCLHSPAMLCNPRTRPGTLLHVLLSESRRLTAL